jgi:hypothetical protein
VFVYIYRSEVAQMPKESDTMQFKLRLSKSLHRKLQREADRHGQTLNAEILQRLQADDASKLIQVHEAAWNKRVDELKAHFDEVLRAVKARKQ